MYSSISLLFALSQTGSVVSKSVLAPEGDIVPGNKVALARGLHWAQKSYGHGNIKVKDFCGTAKGNPNFMACFKIKEHGYALGDRERVKPGHCSDKTRAGYDHVYITTDSNVSAVGEDLGQGWADLLSAKLPVIERGKRVCMNIPKAGNPVWFYPVVYKVRANLVSTTLGRTNPQVKFALAEAWTMRLLPNGAVDGVVGSY
ncbi:hypothetical protein DSO57_1001713 [Entomophthora muscae]|uniref:Uncharacterized protein n=1 Tax=Entomophthora muscae TaxID=34485 RepID=A0ACC2SLW5_9FUNG|nr:hypothetical protein DSO57_1001713 [Entomophthora muscae]